jgi:hypothetical protein
MLKCRMHIVLAPFVKIMHTLVYTSKLSKWIRETPSPARSDFYTWHHNYNKRYELYNYLIESEKLDRIDYLEFGVAQGRSFIWWADHISSPEARFYGFDTFTGLPDDWGGFKKGEMSADGKFPKADDSRCTCFAGLFQETLPVFLRTYDPLHRKIIHMDADLYSSTLFVLTSMAPFLEKGDIIIFDEFNVPLSEFRAFSDFSDAYGIGFELLASYNNYFQTAFKVSTIPGR